MEALTEWKPPVTRYTCPISVCPWVHDDPGPSTAGAFTSDPAAIAAAHMLGMEGTVREHLETHPLIDWAREIARLREDAARTGRNASTVAVILLRRLGKTAEITDAEMAAEQGTLVREPVPHGFRLTVRG